MEEIKNENVNVNDIEEIEEVVAAVRVVAVVAVGAGIGALNYKNREKIDECHINKLRKKGYMISKIEDDKCVDFEDSDEVEEAE